MLALQFLFVLLDLPVEIRLFLLERLQAISNQSSGTESHHGAGTGDATALPTTPPKAASPTVPTAAPSLGLSSAMNTR